MNAKVQIICSATAVTFAAGIWYFYQKKKQTIPENWEAVGNVGKLFVYPLKSGRRVDVESAQCSIYGLIATSDNGQQIRDRSFVVYDASNNEFKTARSHPKLLLIQSSINEDDTFTFDTPGQPTLKVKLPNPKETKSSFITLHFGEKVTTLDCGGEAAKWVSQFLTGNPTGLRVGYHDGQYKRNSSKAINNLVKAHKNFHKKYLGMYADVTGYLLINESSVDKLNAELEEPVSINNFRPNILVQGDIPAFSEENWDFIKIGDAIFRRTMPCTRCMITTLNPETADRSLNREPLKTLERVNVLKDPEDIKQNGKLPVMGINLGLIKYGSIKAGDTVYISSNSA